MNTARGWPHRRTRRSPLPGIALLLSICASVPTIAQQGEPPEQAQQPQTFQVTTKSVATPAAHAKPGVIATADDLLAALETAGTDLRSLKADLRWTKQFGEIAGGDEKQIKTGTLYFDSKPPAKPGERPGRRFQVDFETEIIDNVQQKKRRSFIFDGSLFVERQPDEKQVFRREIVPPGEAIDPLAIGEGPFPVPIGQQKSKIIERFEATLVPPGDDFPDRQPPASLRDTYQLKLTPLPGTDEAKLYRSVRIWYRADDLLPRMARTTDRDESVTEVFLTNMLVNQALPAGIFDTSLAASCEGDDQEFQREPEPARTDP